MGNEKDPLGILGTEQTKDPLGILATEPVKKKEPTPEEKGVQSTNGSATVSEQQSKSGAGANLPPITLSEETFQQGQAKGDVLKQPFRDEASYQKGRVESMAASRREEGKKLERDVAQELKDKTAKEKELTLKEKLYNYLKGYVGEQNGDVQVTEQVEDLTPIDPFKNIDLQIQELEPINVREEGVDEGLRQSVLMKNFKLQKAIKKDREEMLPVLQNIKTQSDLNKVFGQTANDINALSEDLKTGEEKLKQDYERARKVNSGSLAEMGFVDSFGNGIKQTVEANDIADALYTGNEQRFGELLEQNYVRGFLYGDQKKNVLGELLGGQAMPIGVTLTAAVLSGGNPAIAGLAGTGYYARLGAGSEATQVYNEARSQGKTHQEAVSLAIDASKTGFVAGGAEGALGATFGVGELAKGAMKLSKPAVKAIFAAAADAGVDAGAAVGMQYYKNMEAAKKGIKRDETEGLLEEGAAEAIFGLGFQILSKGAGKLKTTAPKVYNQLITQYGKIRPDIVNGTIDQAVKTGEISEADGQQLKEDLGKSNAAQQKLESVEIPEEKKAEIVQIQTKIDDLEAQKENASPAVLPAIEKQIEDLSGKLQVEAAIPLTAKEKTELNKLQTAKVENKAYDKDRLKVLEKRQEAAQKAADEKKEAAKKAKEEETIKRQQEEETAKLQEQKAEANDKENITGVSGEVGIGQEPIETQPIEEGGGGKVEGGGVLEKTQEVTPTETTTETVAKIPKTDKEIVLFKGQIGKLNADGSRRTAHPNAEGFFATENEETAKRYSGEDNPQKITLPKDVTIEEVEVSDKNKPITEIRREEEKLINQSKAQVVKLKTIDAKGKEVQYIVKDKTLLSEKPIKQKIRSESLENGGMRYFAYDENGDIGSIDVEKVGDKIIIDNAFVEKDYQRKGIAKSLVEQIKKDFKAKDEDIEFGMAVSEEGAAFKEALGKKESVKEPQKAEPTEETAIFAEVNNAKSQVARDKAFEKLPEAIREKAREVHSNFNDYLSKLKKLKEEGKIEFETDC